MVKKNVFFIQEPLGETSKLETLSESEVLDLHIPVLEQQRMEGRKGGVVFRTVLQEAGVVNNNKRCYNKSALASALKEESHKINSGTLYGELDHPPATSPERFAQVRLQDACFRLLSTKWNGNILEGVGETLSTAKGKDMKGLIVDNGIKLGFSLRALGKAQINPSTGISEVVAPMKVITYDCVSNPSHSNAVMSEVLSESQLIVAQKDSQLNALMENESHMQMIAEGFGYDLEDLIKQERVVADNKNGLAILALDDKTIKTFLEVDTLDVFVKMSKKYFI